MQFTKRLRIGLLLLILSSLASALIFDVWRTTNQGAVVGQADGIEPGGDRHNSYAWCQEKMTVNGVEYIYVGSNRDLLRLVALTTGASDALLAQFFQGDVATGGTDWSARLFRYRVDGTGTWERVYTSPTFPSNGSIPLFPVGSPVPFDLGYRGMANFNGDLYVVSLGSAYSRVLRFPQSGAGPEEVMRSPGTSLRAIDVSHNQLIIGTEDNRIFASGAPAVQGPVNLLNPATYTATDGWTQIAANTDLGNPAPADKVGVWEFESVGEVLYASLGQPHGNSPSPQGFRLYKGSFPGVGQPGANAAGWRWDAIVEEGGAYPRGLGNSNNATAALEQFNGHLYIGTLMDVIDQTAQGTVFQNFTPCQLYRLADNGTIEMVMGDPNGLFPNRVGNYRAGFYVPPAEQANFPAPYNEMNLSLHPYLWWMEVHEGKLYVSTFDMAIFLRYVTGEVLTALNIDPARQQQILDQLALARSEKMNPEGFDLYVTSNGTDFTPVTRNGFGDRYNYGGRTLLSTSAGLSVGTANPFYGCQVYRVNAREDAAVVPPTETPAVIGGPTVENPSSSGISCFVATAAYGSPLAGELNVLRSFRDRFLLTHAPGRAFVDWYYSHGPTWAAYLNEHPALKPWVRAGLYPVVGMAWLMVSGWILLAIVPGLWYLRKRRLQAAAR